MVSVSCGCHHVHDILCEFSPTKLQLLRTQTWPAWQTEHTYVPLLSLLMLCIGGTTRGSGHKMGMFLPQPSFLELDHVYMLCDLTCQVWLINSTQTKVMG